MWTNIKAFFLGERPQAHLPERVRQSIAAHQIESEILIGWVQLLLVGFFAALYTIAPKTSAGTGFTPVPWALGMYCLFTLIRLSFAYRRVMPRVLLFVSVIMDMGLLMVLIWSFHLQYEQPAPFYLKAPTLLYVFIFISLRALRFDPKYVITAGIAAAAGWLILLLVALDDMAGMRDPITRNYVLYMTSNRVLVGAEIDKILSILLVTLILAVALVRARRLLTRAIVDQTVASDLSRFVSPEIADRITTADQAMQPGDGEIRFASVMFTDIEGFSTISERLRPDELASTLNDYFAAVSTVIDRHGGVITQFEGDAMMVSFNTVAHDPDHAANAVRAAIGIQRIVHEQRFGNGIELKTRCGINTGEVIAGAVGTKERLLFTVHGDEVNIAARLEQLNKEYGTYLLATEETVRQAGGDFGFEAMGKVTVRGRAGETAVYAIRSLPEATTALQTDEAPS
jgi:adenylate cyclase